MLKIPTREEVILLASKLAEGKADPVATARWAQRFYHQENAKTLALLEEKDSVLEEFIGTLVLADAINEKGQLLYGTEDFKSWLDEFLSDIDKK